jgi:hypothetical protein
MAQRADVGGARGPITKYCSRETFGLVALQRDHLLADVQVDVRQGGDAVDEIARHRRLQPFPAHDQMQTLDLGREEHDGLTREWASYIACATFSITIAEPSPMQRLRNTILPPS